jgi:hypothetical protein
MSDAETPLEGGCACGRIRYRITRTPNTVAACHCRRCQYFAGGGPNYSIVVARGGLEITEGEPKQVELRADRGMRVDRFFCPDCGTHLFSDTADRPYTPVRVGTLDDPEPWAPKFHMWTEAAPAWHPIDSGRPQFDKAPN